jgi:hypothetical protein
MIKVVKYGITQNYSAVDKRAPNEYRVMLNIWQGMSPCPERLWGPPDPYGDTCIFHIYIKQNSKGVKLE